jgi:F420H(2)-dependent quinone reductase
MMNDALVKRLSRLHRGVFRATGGRVGKRLVDNDMLLLTTRGRRTGRDHTVPLLFLRDGRRLVVIASYGGRHHAPDWYLNLAADPAVRVRTSEGTWVGHATTAGPQERARWWLRVVAAYKGYAEYQSRTDREIPVVFIDQKDVAE